MGELSNQELRDLRDASHREATRNPHRYFSGYPEARFAPNGIVYMSAEDVERLPEYSGTMPTGVYIDKVWKCLKKRADVEPMTPDNEWRMGRYEYEPEERVIVARFYDIVAPGEEIAEPGFYPQTAREGLLEIRRLARPGIENGPVTLESVRAMDRVAEAALARREPGNFEFTDELADRLALAHHALRKVDRKGFENDPGLEQEVIDALVLPPTLESVVERRIGPWERKGQYAG